jgi:hypothetical protein
MQLMSYSSIGRGALTLTELDSQKKRNIKIPIKNDADKTIAVLEVNAQFVYSVRKIYQQELKSIKTKIDFVRKEQKAMETKIECLTVICPGLKRHVNMDFYEKNRRKIIFEAESNSKYHLYIWIISILIYVLIGLNVFMSLTTPNLAELATLLVFVIEMHFDDFMKYKNTAIAVSLCFIVKDILGLLIFSSTDFTQQTSKMELGYSILRINRGLQILSAALKGALAVLIMLTHRAEV